jgi:hypothetical protein
MRVCAVWTSLATIVTLNVVIGLGLFNVGDTPLYVCMLGPAILPTVVAGMLVVATLQLTGPEFSRDLHLLIDLGTLNAYLAVVPVYRPTIDFSGSREMPRRLCHNDGKWKWRWQ